MKYALVVLTLLAVVFYGGRVAADEASHETPATETHSAPATGEASATATEEHKAEGEHAEKEMTEEEHEADIFTNGKPDAQKIFGLVLEHLHDTYELHFFSAKVPLPIMFLDDHGFHFFASLHALEESGEYREKGMHELDEETKKAQFFKVSPFKRVDNAPMGTFWDFSITANVFYMILA